MAYIQTTNRLIHVKEDLINLEDRLFKDPKHVLQLEYPDFITVTEVIPEIDIYEKRDEFYFGSNNSWETYTNEEIEYKWNKVKEQLERENEKNSKGRKILIRVNDIMELHDER